MAGKITIVAVDDDPDMLALVGAALRDDPDIELVPVGDPIEGLKVIRRLRPTIVLVDLVMPQMNGIELLEHIVEMDRAIDVILMTAAYTTETAVDAIRKGACDYINKPITRDALRKRIDPLIVEAKRLQTTRQLDEAMVQACRFEGALMFQDGGPVRTYLSDRQHSVGDGERPFDRTVEGDAHDRVGRSRCSDSLWICIEIAIDRGIAQQYALVLEVMAPDHRPVIVQTFQGLGPIELIDK